MDLNKYIDLCLIDEYAIKDRYGDSLDIDLISDNDLENYLRMLMNNDTTIRDLVRFHMQEKINERLYYRQQRGIAC